MGDSRDSMLLTTSGVGSLLGVHPSTVKRWAEDESIPAEKTRGGHRRYHLKAVLELANEKGIQTLLDPFNPWEANAWLAINHAATFGDFRRLNSLTMNWLNLGETDLIARLFFVLGNHPEIPFTTFLDEAIRGFMTKVGEEWRLGRLQVGEEHMATQVVMEALIRLRTGWERSELPREEPRDRPPVAVVGALEGDTHELGALSVRVLLEREGWKVYYLGANVPLDDIASIQQGQVADLVCISFSSNATPPDLQRAVRVLSRSYRPQNPFALAFGGAVGELPEGMKLNEGPFLDFSLSRSAEEFRRWVRTLPQAPESATNGSRRVA